jgi:hypothetical protein
LSPFVAVNDDLVIALRTGLRALLY